LGEELGDYNGGLEGQKYYVFRVYWRRTGNYLYVNELHNAFRYNELNGDMDYLIKFEKGIVYPHLEPNDYFSFTEK
jgi:hypothetical protein